MAKFLTKLLGLPYGDPRMTQWYDIYKQALLATDTSLFSHRENKDLISIGGGNIAYNNVSFELGWDATIQIVHPISGRKNDIAATILSDVAFGSYIYVRIKRNLHNNGGVISTSQIKIGSVLPNDDFNYVLFYVTDSGEIISNINTTITSTPVDNSIIIDIDNINTYDFPNNPIIDNTLLDSLLIDDSVRFNNKGLSFQLRYPLDKETKIFTTNFIVSSPDNTKDAYYSIKIDKQIVGGSSLSLVPVLSIDNNKTLTSADDIVLLSDDNTFTMIPGEFYKFEIIFKNDNVSYLGSSNIIKLYSIFLLGI